MPASGIVMSPIRDVLVINFAQAAIVDGPAVDAIRGELLDAVSESGARKVILDFAEVRFLSSSLLGVLVDLEAAIRANRGDLVLCGLRPELHKVFRITRLDKRLRFEKDEARALACFGIHMQRK